MSYCTDLLYGQGLTLCFPYNALEPLMIHPPESAAVQSTKGQTGATNATASAAIPTDPTNTFENLTTAETSQK